MVWISATVQLMTTPFAVFDLHFCPQSYGLPSKFGIATSTGSLALYSIAFSSDNLGESQAETPVISHTQTLQLFPKDLLITFFAWHPTLENIVGVTLSTGEVKLCSLNPYNGDQLWSRRLQQIYPIMSLPSHDLEAWFIAFASGGQGAFSGGDDSALKFSPLPDGEKILKLADPEGGDASTFGSWEEERETGSGSQWTDKRSHGAGVTAILPLVGNILLTGSYDDHVRVLDCLPIGRRRVLLEENLEGGVWRLKLMHQRSDPNDSSTMVFRVLASCMHAGSHVIDITKQDDVWNLEVKFKFEEHKSMNYGSDFQPVDEDGQSSIVSTSFYDRLVCLWRI